MDLVLNEVLYDPDGADGGYEFVELAARPGVAPDAGLAGWTLETGNGADGQWRVAWVGGATDRLHAGLFLIGESGVEPRPHAVADLDLQNGPDACRLRAPSGQTDVLGWGPGLPDGLFEGAAAPDVSGTSLARLPDGVDTDDNTADFRAMSGTPGDFNAPLILALVDSWQPPPRDLPPGTQWTFVARVRNAGRIAWQQPLEIVCRLHRAEVLASLAPEGPLLPGQSTELRALASPPPGAHLPVTDPPAPTMASLWRGPGEDLGISEVFAHPTAEDVEWVELRSVSGRAMDMSALTLRDAAGSGGRLSGELPPQGFLVVTEDSARFASRWTVPAACPIVTLSSWPSVNHTGRATDTAERLSLIVTTSEEDAAEEIGAAALPGGIEESISWERISLRLSGDLLSSWAESLSPAGATPGRENSRPAERRVDIAAGSLVVTPSPFRPWRDGAALIVLRPERPIASCRVTVHDSAGRVVATLSPWLGEGGEHRAVWDGRRASGDPAALGLYLVCATSGDAAPRRATVVLAQ